jgi:hypothetical protein
VQTSATNPRSLDLFDFDGADYNAAFDQVRLSGQLQRVRDYMLTAGWRTVPEIRAALEALHRGEHFPETSVSAQLRNLRKEKFGAHDVLRRRRGDPKRGEFEFKVQRRLMRTH